MKKYIYLSVMFVLALLGFTQSFAAAAQKAYFAGGCFWCMQPPFDATPGVIKTTVGYMGGSMKNPTYEEVSSGTTGHVESMEVTYDPDKVSYDQLLQIYWHNVDPTRKDGQFCDKGYQYRPVIFYGNDSQKRAAQQSKNSLIKSGIIKQPILVDVLPATPFYAAEEYHQEYYKKNPVRYKYYRYSCGRDKRLEQLWGE